MLSSEQYRAYLDRIGPLEVGKPDLATLVQLQARHLLRIPFENLSISRGETIRLREEWLFDKIVVRKRSGFCDELNGLFGALLRTPGYGVDH